MTAHAITTAAAVKRMLRDRTCSSRKPTAVGGRTSGNEAMASMMVRDRARHDNAATIVASGATISVLITATRSVSPTTLISGISDTSRLSEDLVAESRCRIYDKAALHVDKLTSAGALACCAEASPDLSS